MDEREKRGFTLQEVSRQAGGSVRTLLQHLASKDYLVLAVFRVWCRAMVARVRESVGKYADPTERLAAIISVSEKLTTARFAARRALTRFPMLCCNVSAGGRQGRAVPALSGGGSKAPSMPADPGRRLAIAAYFIPLSSPITTSGFRHGRPLARPKPSPILLFPSACVAGRRICQRDSTHRSPRAGEINPAPYSRSGHKPPELSLRAPVRSCSRPNR